MPLWDMVPPFFLGEHHGTCIHRLLYCWLDSEHSRSSGARLLTVDQQQLTLRLSRRPKDIPPSVVRPAG